MKKLVTFLIMGLVAFCVSCDRGNTNGTNPNSTSNEISDGELTLSITPKSEGVEYNSDDKPGLISINFEDTATDVRVPVENTSITCKDIADDILESLNTFSATKFMVESIRTDSLDEMVLENEMALTFRITFIAKEGFSFANPSNDKSITFVVNVDKSPRIPDSDVNFSVTPVALEGVVYERIDIENAQDISPTTEGPRDEPPADAALATVEGDNTTLTFNDLKSSIERGEITIIPNDNLNKENFEVENIPVPVNIPNIVGTGRNRLGFDYKITAKRGYKFEDGETEKSVVIAVHVYKPALPTPEE